MTLKEIIQKSDNIVFFGGAGVSTDSGIPDFRGTVACMMQRMSPTSIISAEIA